jgi:predicted DsbA family dithiol-disulfide isomerase
LLLFCVSPALAAGSAADAKATQDARTRFHRGVQLYNEGSFEAALAEFGHRDEVEVIYRSFELDPSAPQVGTESIRDVLARKYGGGADSIATMMSRVSDLAAEEGLRFDYEHVAHTKTVDAHRLLHLALETGGPALQSDLKEALLSAYFTRGESMGDHAVLRRVAVQVGLDERRVDQVLGGDEFTDDVQADIARARAYGATGVPFFVIDAKFGISGAQPTDTFRQVLEQAWEAAHPVLALTSTGAPAGEVCGPDGCAV